MQSNTPELFRCRIILVTDNEGRVTGKIKVTSYSSPTPYIAERSAISFGRFNYGHPSNNRIHAWLGLRVCVDSATNKVFLPMSEFKHLSWAVTLNVQIAQYFTISSYCFSVISKSSTLDMHVASIRKAQSWEYHVINITVTITVQYLLELRGLHAANVINTMRTVNLISLPLLCYC
jgi:hypothetical protein